MKITSQEAITRLASVNHAIDIKYLKNKEEAVVELKEQEDRKSVPHRDFVLYIRDEMVNQPVGLVKSLPDGDQAFSISILPDFLTPKKLADLVKKQKQESLIDVDPDLRYQNSLADP